MQSTAAGVSLAATGPLAFGQKTAGVPSFLKDVTEGYSDDPRAAAIKWFHGAQFGLFLHYGLYSLLGRHAAFAATIGRLFDKR